LDTAFWLPRISTRSNPIDGSILASGAWKNLDTTAGITRLREMNKPTTGEISITASGLRGVSDPETACH
jgi:hypothetical protein